MKVNSKIFTMWGKWLAGMLLGAIVATGKNPVSLTLDDWAHIANVLWAALVPVVSAWLNPSHPLTMTVPTETTK